MPWRQKQLQGNKLRLQVAQDERPAQQVTCDAGDKA
jgi:hypothetical protein